MFDKDFHTDFIVKIHNYISYDETEELVSYDIDIVKCWQEIFVNDDEAIMFMKEVGILNNPKKLLATVLGTKIMRIMEKEVRRTTDSQNPITDRIIEMIYVLIIDEVSSASIDFGENKNLVLEVENANL